MWWETPGLGTVMTRWQEVTLASVGRGLEGWGKQGAIRDHSKAEAWALQGTAGRVSGAGGRGQVWGPGSKAPAHSKCFHLLRGPGVSGADPQTLRTRHLGKGCGRRNG